MMTTKMMKRTAVAALVGAVSFGAAGMAEVSASTLSVPQQVQQLAWGGKRKKKSGNRYSQGSINTAIIAGAVVGAIIAKNT